MLGRGMCTACYQRVLKSERDGESMEATASVEGSDYLDQVIGGDADLGGEAARQVGPAVERRPGMVTSPSPSLGGVEPPKKKGWRFWEKKETANNEQPRAPKTKEARPKSARRNSSAQTIEDVWSGIGGLAVRSGRHAPVGRCLQWQAPVAGEMLDEAIKGTALDRLILQPITKGRGRFDALGAILGPPLIVLAIERNPQNAEMLIPALKASIRNSLPLMVPAIKKVQAREAAAAEAARELFPDLAPGADPVEEIIAMMFSDWTPQPQPQPDYTVEHEPSMEGAA